jgi:hypothetical protein
MKTTRTIPMLRDQETGLTIVRLLMNLFVKKEIPHNSFLCDINSA